MLHDSRLPIKNDCDRIMDASLRSMHFNKMDKAFAFRLKIFNRFGKGALRDIVPVEKIV